jgi:hypothetical protein
VFYTSFCRYIIVVSDDVGHSSMLASIELKKRENRDDLDFLQMNGYVPCGQNVKILIISPKSI